MTAQILTQARLRELLHYDPGTGVFTSQTKRGRFRAGTVMGTLNRSGRIHLHIDNKKYFAHRLAWLYTTGNWPLHEIDHINGVPTDNRISNLREATAKQNGENRGKQRNNTSGYKGVTWSKKSQKWQAQICHNGTRKQLGVFVDPKAAHKAYLVAVNQLFTHTDRISQE
jgi:hypothetical protein